MVIIARPVIRDFIARYPLSANTLNKWYDITKQSEWRNFREVKETWNSCDAIGNDRYVFDIGGNKYRLIAMIRFTQRTLYIRKICTHEEYTQLGKRRMLQQL